jgi:hypothetical protein
MTQHVLMNDPDEHHETLYALLLRCSSSLKLFLAMAPR